MELRIIEDFLSLAQTGSFTRSAIERSITQPAFSRRIKSLENWMGASLIDRSSYPTRLTPAGEIFRSTAEDILRRIGMARMDIADLIGDESDTISIAVLHTLSLMFVPKWLRQMEALGETPRCSFSSDNLYSCIEMLVEHGVDLLLCFTHASAPLPLDPDRYTCLTLGRDKVIPVCAPGSDGAPKYVLPGTAEEPCHMLCYTTDSYLGQVIKHMNESHRVRPHLKTVYENSFTEALRAAALAGHGIAWLPTGLVRDDIAKGTLMFAAPVSWSLDIEIRLYRSAGGMRCEVEEFWNRCVQISETQTMQIEA